MKKVVSLFFLIPTALVGISAFANPKGTVDDPWLIGSPTAKDVVAYTNDVNTLIIEGTGAITNYTWQGDVPWKDARGAIVRAEIVSGVTNVGGYTFYKCPNLKEVILPNTVTSIGDSAFAHCAAITKIDLPEGVTEIGESAFYVCENLRELTIPIGVKQINSLTFSWCGKLEALTLMSATPPSMDNENAFSNCTSLRAIYVPEESVDAYRQEANWSTFGERIQPMPPPGHRDNPWKIGSPNVNNVLAYIDDSTLFIEGTGAMMDFESKIETPWYNDCERFSKVEIDTGITHLSNYAFTGCGITKVISDATTPPQGGSSAFAEVSQGCKWIVPCGAINEYASANETFNWCFQGTFEEYYSVNIATAEHGRVSVNWSTRLFGGEEIKVTVVPDEQYYLASLVYFDGEEHNITTTKSFIMPKANVTVAAVFETAPQGSPFNPWKIGDGSDNVFAYTNDLHTLVIEGAGATKNFDVTKPDVPWLEFCTDITSVIVGPEVKYLGSGICLGMNNLSRIVIKSPTVIDIGASAFYSFGFHCIMCVPPGLKTSYEDRVLSWMFEGTIAEYYEVEVKPSENGRITVDKQFVLSKDERTVRVTAYPDANCRLSSLVYSDGEEHDITEALSFTMPKDRNVTLTAVFAKLGTKGYPWTVNDSVTAYLDEDGTLVIEGIGAVTSTPWASQSRVITSLWVAEGITDFGKSLSTLPNLNRINGLALMTFSSAAVGVAKASGITAFAVDSTTSTADLRFTVKTASSISADEKDWKTAAEIPVSVKAEGPAGFFVITPGG